MFPFKKYLFFLYFALLDVASPPHKYSTTRSYRRPIMLFIQLQRLRPEERLKELRCDSSVDGGCPAIIDEMVALLPDPIGSKSVCRVPHGEAFIWKGIEDGLLVSSHLLLCRSSFPPPSTN